MEGKTKRMKRRSLDEQWEGFKDMPSYLCLVLWTREGFKVITLLAIICGERKSTDKTPQGWVIGVIPPIGISYLVSLLSSF